MIEENTYVTCVTCMCLTHIGDSYAIGVKETRGDGGDVVTGGMGQ